MQHQKKHQKIIILFRHQKGLNIAVKDVKEYYFKLIAQKAELEADLADFEEALKNGFITEEQMQAAKDELIPYQINLDRLTYIMYLLELPNRKAKKAKFAKQNKKILNELEKRKADERSVISENKSALDAFRKEVKELLNKKTM